MDDRPPYELAQINIARMRAPLDSTEMEEFREFIGPINALAERQEGFIWRLLSGTVVRGDAIGRTIGFPTANLDLGSSHKLLPADGVYAVHTRIRSPIAKDTAQPLDNLERLPAMLYVGERPSLEGKRPRSIEVNVLDFDGDLYGVTLQVDLLHHLRDDRSFDSLDELRDQLARDEVATRQLLPGS